MPIRVAEPSTKPSDLNSVAEDYLIFFSSIVDGRLWCPDCVAVDSLVKHTFGQDGPSAVLVYVGDRATWKTPSNVFRGEPWKVQSVPTIIKINNGEEVSRLVDDEIAQKLEMTAVDSIAIY